MSKKKTEIYLEGLEELPRMSKGINWNESIKHKVKRIYKGEEFEFEITGYGRNKSGYLTIKYNEEEFDILTDGFIRGNLGRILGKHTNEYKIDIGKIFKDEKRDLVIIDREYRKDKGKIGRKYYRYKCNRCGFECGEHYRNGEYKEKFWIVESSLLDGNGCACCCTSPRIVAPNINSIVAKEEAQWMIPYFVGGYEEAKKYTRTSNQKIQCICPDCGNIKNIKIINLYNGGFSCSLCSDGISYPNKFMFNVLEQLNIEFITEYSPKWCRYKYKNKTKKGRYDFYIPSMKLIVEMDGGFHNKDNSMSGQTKEESKASDNYKDKLAKEHGIEVIRIDCDYIDINIRKKYLIDNVLKSKLKNVFDLQRINWNLVEEFSLSSNVKIVCKLWNSGLTDKKELCKKLKASYSAVLSYLKSGKDLGWCDYNPKKEMKMSGLKNGKALGKPVKISKDRINLGIFPSTCELERQSEKVFGIKLLQGQISAVCLGKKPQYKGFTFEYIEENIDTKLHNQELVQAS